MDPVTLGMANAEARRRHAAWTVGRNPVPVVDYRARPFFGGLSSGTDTDGNARYRHTAILTSTGPRFYFPNFYTAAGQETNGPNPITVNAAIELTGTDGTTIIPLTFAGQLAVTIPGGTGVWSDPVGVTLKRLQVFYSRTHVQVAAGGKWPQNVKTVGNIGEGNVRSTSAQDLTASGSLGSVESQAYGPAAVWALPVDARPSILGFVTDSVGSGTGETGDNTDKGFLVRAVGTNYAYQHVGVPSGLAMHWVDGLYERFHYRRGPLIDRCSHIITNLGINDLPGKTLAQMQLALFRQWVNLGARGSRIHQTTLAPKTTSTDNWATLANQTATTDDPVRIGVNDWLRDGAPVTAALATPFGLAAGTRAGAAGHPLSGYIEAADAVESARNSGKWQVGMVYTTDAAGIHPSSAGHAKMAAEIVLPPGLTVAL
jgi:hypothetical protein